MAMRAGLADTAVVYLIVVVKLIRILIFIFRVIRLRGDLDVMTRDSPSWFTELSLQS